MNATIMKNILSNISTIGRTIKSIDQSLEESQFLNIRSEYTLFCNKYSLNRSTFDNWKKSYEDYLKDKKTEIQLPKLQIVIELIHLIRIDFNITLEDFIYRKISHSELIDSNYVNKKFMSSKYFFYYLNPNSEDKKLHKGCLTFVNPTSNKSPYDVILSLSSSEICNHKSLCHTCRCSYLKVKMNKNQIVLNSQYDNEEFFYISIKRPFKQSNPSLPYIGGLCLFSGIIRDESNHFTPITTTGFLSPIEIENDFSTFIINALSESNDSNFKYQNETCLTISKFVSEEVYSQLKKYLIDTTTIHSINSDHYKETTYLDYNFDKFASQESIKLIANWMNEKFRTNPEWKYLLNRRQ